MPAHADDKQTVDDRASGSIKSHGLSTFGVLKYNPDFKHLDYANPDAPKGGKLSMIGTEARVTFDSFNLFIRKGDRAQGLEYIYDSLMTRAYDEPDAVYGLLAQFAEVHNDKKGVTFYLRPEAKFADGERVKASDVVFTIETLKSKGHPRYRVSLRDVELVEALDDKTVRFRFKGNQTRDLPQRVAELPIIPEHFYKTVPFEKAGLDLPLGSGPYKVGKFQQGRYVRLMRRDDYWAKDLPINKGRFNFDELRYEYFKDRGAEFEALKAGVFDLREEFTSKDWATKYKFDAIKKKKVIADTLRDDTPSGTQGFFINTRREKFKDIRVREAIGLAFDFEWTNKNLFYNLYKRTSSYFENSEFKAMGLPSEAELALLTPFKDKLNKSVFEEIKLSPKTNGTGQDRKNLRKASRLLKAAGWSMKKGVRTNQAGEPLTIEFLTFSPSFSRIILPIIRNLKTLGIQATLRLVDPAQYQERLKSFDFDLTTSRFSMRLTPGVELRNFFGSKAAKQAASFNLAGISHPVIDDLIDKISSAKTRADLVTACRALDRVLRSEFYWVPHWYKNAHNVAYWNKFSRPLKKPLYHRGIIDLWWFDKEKAAKLPSK
ncbi:MAG: ABC transporter substrate-binding protein [Rhizobiales bacterium]|nr:ABC transporter substrate-binding protein [Hyphomicrobiales bacterium]